MKKISVLIAVCLISGVFLFVQLIFHGMMDITVITARIPGISYFGSSSRQEYASWIAVRDFTKMCKHLGIQATLIDPGTLKHLITRLQSSSSVNKSSSYSHGNCHYFCDNKYYSFGIFGSELQDKEILDKLIWMSKEEKFDTYVGKGSDTRFQTLEQLATRDLLLYHMFLHRDKIIIHLVIFHERLNHMWHSDCSCVSLPRASNRYINTLLKNLITQNSFCLTEGILQRFTLKRYVMDGIQLNIPEFPKSYVDELQYSKFIPCNLKSARKFYSKYGYDNGADAATFRLTAKNLLSLAKNVLDELGVQFWLSSGTCLGWFRQCDFIPYSKDVDVGIWIKNHDSRIIEEFQRAGLILKHVFGKITDSYELSFRTPSNDLKLDIFFFYEEKDYMWNGGTQARTGKKFKYIFPKFSLCRTELVGLLVRVPCDTRSYIEANYGVTWNLMIKQWDWKKSPPNVRPNGEWPKNEWPSVIQVFQ